MPTLDVTDVLLSPEFLDTTLVVKRNEQTVDDDGFPKNITTETPFGGVVTVDRSPDYHHLPPEQRQHRH